MYSASLSYKQFLEARKSVCHSKLHKLKLAMSKMSKMFKEYLVNPKDGNYILDEFYDYTYKTISSGGRFMNNVGGPVKDKVAFQSKYKFVLASENSSQRGYCTEKLIQAFMSNAIPIYWGDPLVGLTFNTESFINCMDYPSFDAVVDRIKEIDNDDDLYLHMLNAPIFINPQTPAIDFKILREFLYHIFDQDLATVKRRNTSNIFARQTQELLDYKYAYFHPFKSAYKRIIERLKRLPNKLRKVQSR